MQGEDGVLGVKAETGVLGMKPESGVLGMKRSSGVAGGEAEKHELEDEPSHESDNMLSNSELKDDEDASLKSKSRIGVRGRGREARVRFRFRKGFEVPRRISRAWDVGGSGN